MVIDKKNEAFRNDLARDLILFKQSLDKVQIKAPSIDKAVNSLRDSSYLPSSNEIVASPFNWGYKIDNLVINIENYDGVQYPKPKNISRLKITLGVNIIAHYLDDSTVVTDPYKHLEFNLVAEGYNKDVPHLLSFHLDRHPESTSIPDEVHPIYHFQVGGRKMEGDMQRNFGNSLILDSPRLMHYPMDLVLGVDFALSNFAPKQWKKLRQDRTYLGILSKSQTRSILPFVKSLSQHFKLVGRTADCWKGSLILPQLVN